MTCLLTVQGNDHDDDGIVENQSCNFISSVIYKAFIIFEIVLM